ncbi:MAG TPA: DNA polymerase III subunit gamma and tau [Cellulomonas sp.]
MIHYSELKQRILKVILKCEACFVQGFNALLKIVEEPPEHVKFIFATTEPDKVIGTIRSRTHHYPFRLVPPDVMTGYLDQLCRAEGVQAGAGVLPLVVRAGGGSVRDSLSVLDQLIAGSGPGGLVYADAVALLGYTHASLLDDLVEAVAARDGASAFRVVERVISTGHEPRRFVEDLLERLRDLIVLAASGDAAAAVLRDVPGDQMTRMQTQAAHLGAAELSRSADLVNAALSEMTGATSPRLHLELLMARLLLPALDDSASGLGARVDRLEREGVRVASAPAATSARSASVAGDDSAPGLRPGAATVAPVGVPAAPAPSPAVPVERVAVVVPAAQPAPVAAPLSDVDGSRPPAGAGASVEAVGRTPAAASSPEDQVGTPPWDVDEHVAAATPSAGPDAVGPATGQDGQDASAPSSDPWPEVSAPVGRPGPDAAEPQAGARVEEHVAPVADTPSAPSTSPTSSVVRAPDGEPDQPGAPAGPEVRSIPEPAPVAAPPMAHDVPAAEPVAPPQRPAGSAGGGDTEMLRRRWPEVLDTLSRMKKTTWVLISQNAQVMELDATTLRLGFTATGLATAFRSGSHAGVVQQAVRETLGFDVLVEPVLTGDAPAAPARQPAAVQRPSSGTPSAAQAAASWDTPASAPAASTAGPVAGPAGAPGEGRPASLAPTAPGRPTGRTDREPGADQSPERDPWADAPSAAPGDDPWATAGPVGDLDDPDPDPTADDARSPAPDGHDGSDGAPAGVARDGRGASGADGARPRPEPSDADRTAGSVADRAGTGAGTPERVDGPGAPGRDGRSEPADASTSAAPASTDPGAASRADGAASARGVDATSGRAAATASASSAATPPWDVPGHDPDDPGPSEPPEDEYGAPSRRPAPRPTASAPASARVTQAPQVAAMSGADRVRAAARGAGFGVSSAPAPARNAWADDEPSMDDPDIGATGVSGVPLIVQMLSATVIDEQMDEGF